MKLAIKTSGNAMGVEVISHIERRADFALASLRNCVDEVDISLIELTDDQDEPDLRCKLQLRLDNGESLLVSETSADVFSAINRAFSVMGHLAVRRLERRHGEPVARAARGMASFAGYGHA